MNKFQLDKFPEKLKTNFNNSALDDCNDIDKRLEYFQTSNGQTRSTKKKYFERKNKLC